MPTNDTPWALAGTPAGAQRLNAAWIRYGGDPITRSQLDFAIKHYSVAIIQPWEKEAAHYLKTHAPNMTVLAYKCLSSSRNYEPGPIYSSGVSYAQAQELLKSRNIDLFARRKDGSLIEWNGYGGHFQMKVWNPDYRWFWTQNVVNEMRNSPFDGVMADNDVENDYYNLRLPISEANDMVTIRAGLEDLVGYAGSELNKIGKLLVPNIAEARLREGKWKRHSAYGGGFEEVWMGWDRDSFLSRSHTLLQGESIYAGAKEKVTLYKNGVKQEVAPVTVLRTPQKHEGGTRVPSTTSSISDPNLDYALAAYWVFGAGRFTGVITTGHDSYNGTPFSPELSMDLGAPLSSSDAPTSHEGVYLREFERGFAALNAGESPVGIIVPRGLVTWDGKAAPEQVYLQPHQGVVYTKA